MTDYQKKAIFRMRQAGKTYKQVSQTLGMKEASVRTFCCRNGLTEKTLGRSHTDDLTQGNGCPQCGCEIVHIPGKKPKRFCSDACRILWWKNHRDKITKKAIYITRCDCCGKEFESYGNKDRKYCSRNCYIQKRFCRETGQNFNAQATR